MGAVRMFGEAFGIFAVSVIVLFVVYMITEKRATGIGVLHWKGYVLMGVGVLYLLLGMIMTRVT
ncbi:MAG TPA: hypothetical protein VK828_06185 [Terriglobales bacterium]|jgi:hypothetical protein|nr:hypothetical protein [Terriglobales bacterium]